MNTNNRVSFVGFVLALSSLTVVDANATESLSRSPFESPTIENRMSRITEAIKQRQIGNEETPNPEANSLTAQWFNRSGRGGGWLKTYGGSFVNRYGGGGFINRRWPDGGRFYRYRY